MLRSTVDSNVFPRSMDEIPERWRLPRVDVRHFLINGELRAWDGSCQQVTSPVCVDAGVEPQRVPIGSFPLLDAKTAREALEAALFAYDHGRGAWPTMTVGERIGHVAAFNARLRTCRTEVVRLLMWEIGKSQVDAEKEFDRTVAYIDDTIAALKELDHAGSRFTNVEGVIGQIRRAPLGVALCLGPFNYPLNETLTTLIPALIMGNTAVFKPPRHGVLLFAPLLEAFRDSFPAGVVNAVFGAGRTVIPPLMNTGAVDVLAFIGTSGAADALQKVHPRPHRLRLVLGLEAKNPAIILPDADLELAVRECIAGALSFNGQRCTALKILFVHEAVAEVFVAALAEALNALPFGMPWDPGVMVTPLPEEGKPEALRALVDDAVQKGAQLVAGGQMQATLLAPALVYPVAPGMRLYDEEQFGPVIPVVPFADLHEPIAYITESNYGQQVSLFGRDSRQMAELIDPLVNQVSRVNLNSQCQRGPDVFPFTGRKDSAVATLSVSDALRAFSIRALVATRESDGNKELLREIVRGRRSRFLSTDYLF